MYRTAHSSRRVSGFTMIEVMVAVLVLSVGLLGLASLQANSLRQNSSAYLRTQAIILANDMADRMRANLTEVAAGAYNNITKADAGTDPVCKSTPCTPDVITTHDIAVWYDNLDTVLQGGDGTVTGDGRLFTITVMWDDNKLGATGTGCDPNNDADMVCFTTTLIP